MEFWQRAKRLIQSQNTTQEWVANHCGIEPDKFRRWVSRPIMPNADQATMIANALGVTVEYLVTGKEIKYWYPPRIADIVEDLKIIDDEVLLDPIRTLAHTAAERIRARDLGPPSEARIAGA